MAQIFDFILVFVSNLNSIESIYWLTLTISLIILIYIFFRGLGLRLIEINSSKILDRLIFISILIIFVSFIFISWSVIIWISRVNFPYL